jgi:hypothetical protein
MFFSCAAFLVWFGFQHNWSKTRFLAIVLLLAGVYEEFRKMNRKFIISHGVTGTILSYPRPLLRLNPCK